MSESLEERFNNLLIALNRLAIQVNKHNNCIAELGQRVNEHTDAIDCIGAILDASCEGLEFEPNHPAVPLKKSTVIRLLEHGDNVVSIPKFRGQ